MNIKVSILIPVYNVEKYLHECLNSIVHQTLKNIEIICINDGSTDNSLEILQEYKAKDPRIKIINKKNTGYGHSMNCGLKKANGDYIGIVESDDFVERDMFDKLYQTISKTKSDIVKSNFFQYKNKKNQIYNYLKDFNLKMPLKPLENGQLFFIQPSIWSNIYNRDFLRKNSIWFNETPGASYQDTSFNFKVLACAEKIILLKEAYYHYRCDNNDSSVKNKGKVYCVCDEYNNIENFLSKHIEIKEKLKFLLPSLKYNTYYGNYIRIDFIYKIEFLIYMIKEFKRYSKQGLLIDKYWPKWAWNKVQSLINIKDDEELLNARKIVQKDQIIQNGILLKLKKADNIIIYGAGLVGKQILEFLQKNYVQISSFAVTDAKNNLANIWGIPIKSITDIKPDKNNTIILVSVKDSDQPEIVNNLSKLGYKNMLLMTKELRQHLY